EPRVAAFVRGPVLVARRVVLVLDARQHVLLDQPLQALREDVAGDAEPLLEVVEAAHAEQGVAHDQQAPPFAHDLEGAGDGAVHVFEAGPTHVTTLIGCVIERTVPVCVACRNSLRYARTRSSTTATLRRRRVTPAAGRCWRCSA